MDKEHTVRAPHAPSLHNRASTFASQYKSVRFTNDSTCLKDQLFQISDNCNIKYFKMVLVNAFINNFINIDYS